jgi:hypothetical protein
MRSKWEKSHDLVHANLKRGDLPRFLLHISIKSFGAKRGHGANEKCGEKMMISDY